MSFDARSLERLQQLGRSLPQPLPAPQANPPAGPSPAGPPPQGKLHRIETENDPQALFRELMQVSPDGHVPPHLMERLKELERHQLQQNQQAARKPGPQAVQSGLGKPNPKLAGVHGDLYTAFQQLLLEDDDS